MKFENVQKLYYLLLLPRVMKNKIMIENTDLQCM